MHVNKINEGNVDLSVETYTYIQEEEEIVNGKTEVNCLTVLGTLISYF